MTKNRDRKVSDFIEWKTISFGDARTWVIVLSIMLLGGGIYYVAKYGLPWGDQVGGQGGRHENALEKKPARFIFLDGDVRVKTTNSFDWTAADVKSVLYPGDMVKTSSDGNCRIAFFDGTVYQVKPNSLICIQECHEERATQNRTVRVELSEGALALSAPERNTGQSHSKLETTATVTDMGSNASAQFMYDPKANDMRVSVTQGLADVTSKANNQTMAVGVNQEVRSAGGFLIKRDLPPQPEIIYPRDSEVLFTNTPHNFSVKLQWKPGAGRRSYHVVISDSDNFTRIAREEQKLVRNIFEARGLDYGIYFWRVTAVDEAGNESTPVIFQTFRISKAKAATDHQIKIDFDPPVFYGNIVEVSGKTDPDNTITINDMYVSVAADGSFKHFTKPFLNTRTATLHIVVKDYSGVKEEFTQVHQLNYYEEKR